MKPGPRRDRLEHHLQRAARAAGGEFSEPADREAINRQLRAAWRGFGPSDTDDPPYLLSLAGPTD